MKNSCASRELSVGELARRAGVAVSALHFYETKGLISSQRNAGNQRRFSRETLRRVVVIKVAQRVGIPLAEIARALQTLPAGRSPSAADWAPVGAVEGGSHRAHRQAAAVARPTGRLHRLRLPVAPGLPVATRRPAFRRGAGERTGWTPRAASTTARQRSAVVLAVGDGRAVLQVVRRDRQGA